MSRPGNLHAAVDTIAALYDQEVEARERGRLLETTGYTAQAEAKFKEATRLRRMRLGMLRQWQLL